MEQSIEREENLLNIFWPAMFVVGVAFALGIIIYGVDSVAPGVHDAFHDFRHVIGMPCH